jgi:phosphate uptake regulator
MEGKNMEIRRVQMTGGSSYIITLPKEWIKKSNIKKNDPVGLLSQSDGTLLLTPKIDREHTQKIKEFDVSNIVNQDYLLRSLIGAYIVGYNSIIIKSSTRMSPAVKMTVRKFTQTTIGQEVVEETDTHIIVKDLLNPAEMPFDRTIKRMHILVKGMHEDIIIAIQRNDKKLVEDVLLRDNEVDRLHWLVARQHNIILQNVSFAEKMGITIELATTSFLISRIIERIGDHVIRIAKNAINLTDEKLDESLIEKLETASHCALEIFNKGIAAFLRRDVKTANETIESVQKLEMKCKEINKLALKQKGEYMISLGYFIESIRRIGEYSADISENVINYLVGVEK